MTIIVGEEERTFTAHEPVLLASSVYIQRAMSGRWNESITNTIRLPEIEPDIFAIYLYWRYFGVLPVQNTDPEAEDLELAKSYVLGDRIMDTSFQNKVIEAFVEKRDELVLFKSRRCFSSVAVKYIYENTLESAKVRKLLVDLYVLTCESSWLLSCRHKDHLPHEFLVELSARLMDRPPRRDNPGSISAEDYFEGVEGSSAESALKDCVKW